MALRELIRRRGRDNRWIAGGLLVLLLLLSLIYYLLLRGRDLPSDLVANRILVFFLWYLNLVLILAIAFVLFRNLFKLAVERRHRILGSKLKTKLVLTYIGLSLVPVLLLFLYGSRLLQGWIDRWFDEPAIQRLAQQGYSVAQELNRELEDRLLRDSRNVLRELASVDVGDPGEHSRLDRLLQQRLRRLDLAYLEVYDGTQFVHGVLSPQSEATDLPEPGTRFLEEALARGEVVRRTNLMTGGGRGPLLPVLQAAVAGEDARGAPILLLAGSALDPEVQGQSAEVINAYLGYRQLEVMKRDIEAGYFLLFLMVTLVILLVFSWVGLYLARRITQPIEALAEATRRISDGELGYRVDIQAEDEIGVLVDSFNRMTSELERSKFLLEESNLELRETNERIARERAVIAAVLQNTAAGVISVDEEGKILTCNGAALKMLRQSEDQVLGRPVEQVWSDGERGKLADLFESDPGPSGRLVRSVRLALGGQWRTFETKVTTMRHREGGVSGRVMVLEDLTELINAQQMAAWNEAARRIAHEIKNPLTPIKLSAERMLRKYEQGDEDLGDSLEEGAEIIVREVETMQDMVDEFSRFARMRRPQPSEVHLGKLVEETLQLYEGLKEGVEIQGEVEEDAATAWLDGEQVKRVLINLLDNAVDATTAPGEVRVTVHRGNGNVRIRVSDTGGGIPPEDKAKLFLPHFSTKGRGTGLGLSIVRRIVTEHHGSVRVEDNEPHGTVFTIDLPQG